MKSVSTKFDAACSRAEDWMRLSSNPADTSALTAFKVAIRKLSEPELDQLTENIRTFGTQTLQNLQNRHDRALQKIQSKRAPIGDIAKIAASILLLLATFFCRTKFRHIFRLGALALVFSAIGKFFFDLSRRLNSPAKLKIALDWLKLVQQARSCELMSQILIFTNDILRVQRDAIAADREAIALEKVGDVANRLLGFATFGSMCPDANQENSHCFTVEQLQRFSAV